MTIRRILCWFVDHDWELSHDDLEDNFFNRMVLDVPPEGALLTSGVCRRCGKKGNSLTARALPTSEAPVRRRS